MDMRYRNGTDMLTWGTGIGQVDMRIGLPCGHGVQE